MLFQDTAGREVAEVPLPWLMICGGFALKPRTFNGVYHLHRRDGNITGSIKTLALKRGEEC